jgi:hypothetical protein
MSWRRRGSKALACNLGTEQSQMVVFMFGSPLNAQQNSCLWTSSQESCVAFKNDIISSGTNPLCRTVHNEVKTVCHLVLCRSVRLLYVINFSSRGLQRIWGADGDVAIWRRVDWYIVINLSIFRERSTLKVEALVTTWQSRPCRTPSDYSENTGRLLLYRYRNLAAEQRFWRSKLSSLNTSPALVFSRVQTCTLCSNATA